MRRRRSARLRTRRVSAKGRKPPPSAPPAAATRTPDAAVRPRRSRRVHTGSLEAPQLKAELTDGLRNLSEHDEQRVPPVLAPRAAAAQRNAHDLERIEREHR